MLSRQNTTNRPGRLCRTPQDIRTLLHPSCHPCRSHRSPSTRHNRCLHRSNRDTQCLRVPRTSHHQQVTETTDSTGYLYSTPTMLRDRGNLFKEVPQFIILTRCQLPKLLLSQLRHLPRPKASSLSKRFACRTTRRFSNHFASIPGQVFVLSSFF